MTSVTGPSARAARTNRALNQTRRNSNSVMLKYFLQHKHLFRQLWKLVTYTNLFHVFPLSKSYSGDIPVAVAPSLVDPHFILWPVSLQLLVVLSQHCTVDFIFPDLTNYILQLPGSIARGLYQGLILNHNTGNKDQPVNKQKVLCSRKWLCKSRGNSFSQNCQLLHQL